MKAMQGIHYLHTAILVSDLEAAEHFYGTILGLPKVDRPTNIKFPGTWYQIGDQQLHLIVSPGYQAPLPNEEKWGRHPHVAFGVADLEATKIRLQNYNCPIQTSASGRAALFTRDPDGNVVELAQA